MAHDLASYCRAIRAECFKQGIDDATRRSIMLKHAGVTSQTALNLPSAKCVLAHLRMSGGAAPESEWAFVDKSPADRRGRLRYIIVMAGKLGIKRGKQKRYVEGIAENMDAKIRVFKESQFAGERSKAVKKPLEFCTADELGDIVNALELQVKRVASRTQAKL